MQLGTPSPCAVDRLMDTPSNGSDDPILLWVVIGVLAIAAILMGIAEYSSSS